uniref:Uncharacterized protein n=1 Tax=Rhizophora mucronata TaxID=61149 RepID=A0A2P2PE38_RHIMU
MLFSPLKKIYLIYPKKGTQFVSLKLAE